MTRKLRLKAERTFQTHREGDVFLAEETPQIAAYVKAKLFSVIAVEEEAPPKPPPAGAKAPVKEKAPVKAKPKAKSKPKAAKSDV